MKNKNNHSSALFLKTSTDSLILITSMKQYKDATFTKEIGDFYSRSWILTTKPTL